MYTAVIQHHAVASRQI